VAVGVGWWREEFTALGAQFARRGSRMEEQIEILRALWRDGTLSYHGKFYDFEGLVSEPRPVQAGGPPILIGGTTERAKERAGRIGDGWHALGSHEQMLTDGFAEVLRSAREAGRRDDDVILSTSIGLPPDAEHALRRLTRLATAGVSQVVVNVAGGAADAIAAIEMLATRVLPEVKPA
jgi:alkanesulfonate monooxygenase SsuD/methylene tetrahydromethanopterin reductase-like flavin-dependent oxidoreductase (luciferase family)